MNLKNIGTKRCFSMRSGDGLSAVSLRIIRFVILATEKEMSCAVSELRALLDAYGKMHFPIPGDNQN